jgi:hypothetical protein
MLLRSFRPRNLAVRDVSHEEMPERMLRLIRDGRLSLAAYELLALERVQASRQLLRVDLGQLRDATRPERLAENSPVLEHGLLVSG